MWTIDLDVEGSLSRMSLFFFTCGDLDMTCANVVIVARCVIKHDGRQWSTVELGIEYTFHDSYQHPSQSYVDESVPTDELDSSR